jgi:hypothetical protein
MGKTLWFKPSTIWWRMVNLLFLNGEVAGIYITMFDWLTWHSLVKHWDFTNSHHGCVRLGNLPPLSNNGKQYGKMMICFNKRETTDWQVDFQIKPRVGIGQSLKSLRLVALWKWTWHSLSAGLSRLHRLGESENGETHKVVPPNDS